MHHGRETKLSISLIGEINKYDRFLNKRNNSTDLRTEIIKVFNLDNQSRQASRITSADYVI